MMSLSEVAVEEGGGGASDPADMRGAAGCQLLGRGHPRAMIRGIDAPGFARKTQRLEFAVDGAGAKVHGVVPFEAFLPHSRPISQCSMDSAR